MADLQVLLHLRNTKNNGIAETRKRKGIKMEKNVIKEVREESTFANFKAKNATQRRVLGRLQTLAEGIIERAEDILTKEYPFSYGQMIFIWGPPGRGKSHLVEAIVNHIRQNKPELLGKIYFSKSNFTHANMCFAEDYDNLPVVVIDDIFSKVNSASNLHPRTDGGALMNFSQEVYERRKLAIITSNFPLQGEIMKLIADSDETGRISSRLNELLANSGEIELRGIDYRTVITKERKKQKGQFTI